MKHWHQCERWERRGLPCPFSSLAQHDDIADSQGATDPRRLPLPGKEPKGSKRQDALKWREPSGVGAKVAFRRADWPGGAPGLPDPKWIQEMLNDGLPGPEEAPEPVGPVPPLPAQPYMPRPPALPVGEPYRNPFADPALQRALAQMRVTAQQRVTASAKAVGQARAMVPQAWRPTQEQITQLGLNQSVTVPQKAIGGREIARAALAEEVTAKTVQQSETSRISKSRLAAGAATVAGAGAAAYVATRRRGGGGGFHTNMSREMKQLIGQHAARRVGQNYSGRQTRTGL